MTSLLFPAFNYIHNNRWAQIVLGVVFIYAAIKARDAWRDRHTAKRVERRIEKKSRRVQQTIREQQDAKHTQVARARESAPRGVPHSDELPDNLRSIIIGN
jgi:hypothetical protein